MPGARSTISNCLSCGRTSAMRGNSRWLTKRPAASTTIQARSKSRPVSVNTASCTATPAQDLTGYTNSWAMVDVVSNATGKVVTGQVFRGEMKRKDAS